MAAFTLGVAHPPSYPLHTLLGHLFCFIPLGNPSFQFNFLSSILGAAGAVLLTVNAWILLAPILRPKTSNGKEHLVLPLVSIFGGLLLAYSKNYWNASITAKGSVYIFQILLALVFFSGIQCLDRLTSKNQKSAEKIPVAHFRRWFYFTITVFSIGLTNHWPTQMILVPPTLLFFYDIHSNRWPRNGKILGWRFGKQLAIVSSFCILFLSSYLYLPVRSHQNPELNFDAPNNFDRMVNSITRADARKTESTLFKQVPFSIFGDHSSGDEKETGSITREKSLYVFHSLIDQLSWMSILLLVAGLWFLYKTSRRRVLYFLILAFLTTVLLNLFYQRLTPIEFWHLDDYLLTVNWVEALLCASGMGFFLSRFTPLAFRATSSFDAHREKALLLIFIALLFYILGKNFSLNNQKREFFYYYYGLETLKSLDANAIYFPETDYDLFSTMYLKKVEAKRSDIIIVPTPFFRKSYAYKDMHLRYPGILPATSSISPFDALSKIVNNFGRPVFYTFTNGIFADLYLKHLPRYHFQPNGILLRLIGRKGHAYAKNPLFELNSFWGKSIANSIRDINPADTILLQACAHPFIDTAEYLEAKGDSADSNWLYNRALLLIQDKNWRAEITAKKTFENKKPDPSEGSGSF